MPIGRLRGIALAATAAVLLALTSCAGGTTHKASSTPFQLTDSTAPGGPIDSFTWSIYAEPTSIDYTQSFDYPPNQILANMCESLLRWNPDLTTSPGLATSYSNPTPTTWVYEIRPNVKFHDGSTLTADDVVASLRRELDPAVATVWQYEYRNVKSVDKTGPMEVTVTLSKPDSMFNKYMATGPGIIESAKTLAEDGKDYGTPDKGVNCTGPFSFVSWTSGQDLVMKRFDDYWDPTLKAKAAQVKFVFITDPNNRVAAFKTGEVDGGWMLPAQAFDQLKGISGGDLYFGRNTTTGSEVVNNLSGPLGDVRVRQALLMATDRQGIVNDGAGGIGSVANSLVSDETWGDQKAAGTANLPTYPYDVAKAKALVKQAGAEGKHVVIATSPIDSETTIVGNAMYKAAKDIGLDPELRVIPPDKYTTLFTDPGARKGIDLFFTLWYTSVTDPLDMYSALESNAYTNYGNWSDPAYDTAIDQAVATGDPAAHTAATIQAQQIALQQLPWLPLYTNPVSVFMGKRITGVAPSIAYLYYPWAATIGARS